MSIDIMANKGITFRAAKAQELTAMHRNDRIPTDRRYRVGTRKKDTIIH